MKYEIHSCKKNPWNSNFLMKSELMCIIQIDNDLLYVNLMTNEKIGIYYLFKILKNVQNIFTHIIHFLPNL